ncbi:hypothetical protein [uncultured Aquimarina sp.]|uniref:hypothetical protein n=1 Tax=uncultured Aquimarina sp. TaxID=575652 RepID=UPI002632DA07|nr:hypothetical protein [uncultured Aquimarina sp.]
MENVKNLIKLHYKSHPDFQYYQLHIEKIEENRRENPDIAIETCKSLIEGVSKTILNNLDVTFDEKRETTGRNPRSVQWFFKEALKKISDNSEDFESGFVQASGQIINITQSIRTERGDISHGKSVPKLVESTPEFADMIVNMTNLIVSYTLKHYFEIDQESDGELDYYSEKLEGYNTWLDDSQPDFPIAKATYSKVLYDNDYDEYENRYSDEYLRSTEELQEEKEDKPKEEQGTKSKVDEENLKILSSNFNEDSFWTAKRLEMLKGLTDNYQFNFLESKNVIAEYLFTDKDPLPDEAIKILKERPSFKERKEKIGFAISRIKMIAGMLSQNDEEE